MVLIAILVVTAKENKFDAEKMDLVGWSKESFDSIKKELKRFLKIPVFSRLLISFFPYFDEQGQNISYPRHSSWYYRYFAGMSRVYGICPGPQGALFGRHESWSK